MEDGHCIATVHAEANAILQAAMNGVRIEGGEIYTTASPCWNCFKLVANAGLVAVYFGEFYREPRIHDYAEPRRHPPRRPCRPSPRPCGALAVRGAGFDQAAEAGARSRDGGRRAARRSLRPSRSPVRSGGA